MTAIRGHVDTRAWARGLPAWEVVTLAARMIYVIHRLGDLDLDPAAAGLDMVVSGHSHMPKTETSQGVVYLILGSAGRRRFGLPVNIATVDLSAVPLGPTIRQVVE